MPGYRPVSRNTRSSRLSVGPCEFTAFRSGLRPSLQAVNSLQTYPQKINYTLHLTKPPVIHVSLTETKYLSHSASACSCIKCFYCLLANFLRIFPCFRVQGVVFFAFFAKAPLTSRTIFSCIHLVFFFSADWTLPTCFCSCFSHSSILPSSALFVHTQNQENSSGNSLAFSDCRPIQSSFSSCFPSSYAV